MREGGRVGGNGGREGGRADLKRCTSAKLSPWSWLRSTTMAASSVTRWPFGLERNAMYTLPRKRHMSVKAQCVPSPNATRTSPSSSGRWCAGDGICSEDHPESGGNGISVRIGARKRGQEAGARSKWSSHRSQSVQSTSDAAVRRGRGARGLRYLYRALGVAGTSERAVPESLAPAWRRRGASRARARDRAAHHRHSRDVSVWYHEYEVRA